MERCCFDCEFFQIDNNDVGELTELDWDLGRATGECRHSPPIVGDLSNSNGEEFRAFGEFPKVFVTEWCGQFQPRNT